MLIAATARASAPRHASTDAHHEPTPAALNEGLRCEKRLWRQADGSNWNHSGWLPGRAGDGAIGCSCWID